MRYNAPQNILYPDSLLFLARKWEKMKVFPFFSPYFSPASSLPFLRLIFIR